MVNFFKRGKRPKIANKTVIVLSEGGIFSIRFNPFFQVFILLGVILVSCFLTYHITIYLRSQSRMQEKDHKIFLGETINKNLSSHLQYVLEEINKISSAISTGSDGRKREQSNTKQQEPVKNSSQAEKILTEEDYKKANAIIRQTVVNLDKEVESKLKVLTSALGQAGLNDLMRRQNVLNYTSYREQNAFRFEDVSFEFEDIASNVLGEVKYKIEYMKALQGLIAKLPTTLPMKGVRITSGYGVRMHPTLRSKIMHHGVDFKGPPRATIHSAGDGVVKFSGYSSSFGNVVIITHGNDIMTIYAHLSAARVRDGQAVKKNDIIGFQGSTGRSTGEHLHFEVRYQGKSVDPIKFFKIADIMK